jgi:uncharacterized protein Usg
MTVQDFLGVNGFYWDILKQKNIPQKFHLEIDDVEYYAGHKNILRLGDGKEGYESAKKIAEAYPNQTVLSSDVNFNSMTVDPDHPNLLQVKVDSTSKFPIPDKSQDLIIMKRGLCACHDVCKTCGGLDLTNRAELIGFFLQVIRVMRTSNPDARAILQGGVFQDYPLAFAAFIDVMKHFKNHPDVEFVYLMRAAKDDDRFFGMMIRPKNWQQ